MSFCVAVRSAIFYFVACTPCAEVRRHQRALRNAKKEREEKARIVAEQPHLYHHPDPYHTNPYWAEEIRMGPSLPKKGKGGDGSNKASSQRGLTNASRDLTSAGTDGSLSTNPTVTRPSTSLKPTRSAPSDLPRMSSSPTVVPDEDATSTVLSKTASASTGDDWNLKRYQREDEELWGHEFSRTGQKLMDAIKQAGSTAGRFVESKLGIEKQVTEEDRYNFYFSPRNPPVNDYHPPVVSSKPIQKDALRWMLQPPPPAKVMEGKIPVSRTASTMSVGSRRTVGTSDGISMGRKDGEKALEAKIRNGETPYGEGELHSTSSLPKTRSRRTTVAGNTRTRTRRAARSHSNSMDLEDSSDSGGVSRSRRPSYRPPTASDADWADSEDEYISRSLEALSNSVHPTHAAQRPRLSTILSSEATMKASTPRTDPSRSTPPLPKEVANASPAPDVRDNNAREQPIRALVDNAIASEA